MTRLPDVIGIGFRRCASSWLHSCLNEHHEVGKTAGGNHYFSENLERGIGWYQEQLAPHADCRVLVDFSVSYSYPENIDAVVGQLPMIQPIPKLFALMRHPVERAFSDYRRSLFREELPPGTTFEQALELEPTYLSRGCYGRILRRFCEVVDQDQIGFFFYDDVQSQPHQFWRSFCEFIGISADLSPSMLQTPAGHLATPRNALMHSFIRRANRILTTTANSVGLGANLLALKKSSVWRKAVTFSMKQDEEIAPATRRRLLTYFEEDIALLAEMSGRDLGGWLE